MIIASMLSWWYSRGWLWSANQLFVVQLGKVYDFFSVGDLLKTLFAPFRQDVIDTRNAPLGVKLNVLGGNIISRLIGAMIRSTLIIVGLVMIVLLAAAGFVAVIAWPFLPLAPVVMLIAFMSGGV